MTLKEKASYVKGLIDGLDIDKETKENRVLLALTDLINDVSISVSDLEDSINDVVDQLDSTDEKISNIEDNMYFNKNQDDDDDDDYEDDDEDDDDIFYEITCPSCNEELCLSEDDILHDDIKCPECGNNIDLDTECGDDCDCCCNHDESNDNL